MKCPSEVHSVILVLKVISLFAVFVSSDIPQAFRDKRPPNIIFILVDDAGWNDFSFHGSPQIPTPNIDALALNGIVLNSYYSSPLCSPTRGAIQTGKHPIHLGLSHFVITGAGRGGLPLKEKILPQYLKELGYSNHIVGKWHLGHSAVEYTPTLRGFDTHFGYWLGKQDYYSHISIDGRDEDGNGMWGYDFRNNTEIHRNVFGQYDTDLFTDEAIRLIYNQPSDKPLFLMINHIAPHSANAYDPLQAPKENVNKFKTTIKDDNRRKYAGMVDRLDESVGLVVEALSRKKMLSNSVIVFVSDNGGAPEGFDLNYGSNWPLRGAKNTLWEGGTRVSAAVWSPLIKSRISKDLMHAQDWLPTIYEACGGDTRNLHGIDGVSLWKTFTEGHPSPRTSLLYNIDDIYNNSAVREGQWKLIQGNTSTSDLGGGVWDFWYGPSGRSDGLAPLNLLVPKIASSTAAKAMAYSGLRLNLTRMSEMQSGAELLCDQSTTRQVPCNPYQKPCLFNVEEDPCELINVADRYPSVVQRLLYLITEHNRTVVPPLPRVLNPQAFPRNHGNVWTTWETPERDHGAHRKEDGGLLATSGLDSHVNNHLDHDGPAHQQRSSKNEGNELAVNYWGNAGQHRKLSLPSHPSHWAVHNLISQTARSPFAVSTSSNSNHHPRSHQTLHSSTSFHRDDQDDHNFPFRIHRNKGWSSSSEGHHRWRNRPFISL